MKMPRRVRRRLLLPPGWVALGFLLLLGCQLLQQWERKLRQMSVLQLTMPKLKLTPADSENYDKEYRIVYKPLAELNKLRPWHNTDFRGSRLLDFLNANATESSIKRIIADTSQAGGMRIRFWPGATYANLVSVLDVMNYTGQKKYWLDIRHYPTTLYAITTKPTHEHKPLLFLCGTRYIEPHLPPKKIGFEELITEFWRKSLVLLSWPWQVVALWLAIISSLSLWRLFQPKLGCSNA